MAENFTFLSEFRWAQDLFKINYPSTGKTPDRHLGPCLDRISPRFFLFVCQKKLTLGQKVTKNNFFRDARKFLAQPPVDAPRQDDSNGGLGSQIGRAVAWVINFPYARRRAPIQLYI